MKKVMMYNFDKLNMNIEGRPCEHVHSADPSINKSQAAYTIVKRAGKDIQVKVKCPDELIKI